MGLWLMENLSSSSVWGIKFLISFFRNGIKIPHINVIEFKVDDIAVNEDEVADLSGSIPHKTFGSVNSPIQIWVDLCINNGLYLFQKNFNYPDFVCIGGKLEGLCWVWQVWIISVMPVILQTCVASIIECCPSYVNSFTVSRRIVISLLSCPVIVE